jgi:hypothetical protein
VVRRSTLDKRLNWTRAKCLERKVECRITMKSLGTELERRFSASIDSDKQRLDKSREKEHLDEVSVWSVFINSLKIS